MRILVPTLSFGRAGGYRVLSEFANQWIKEGHEVDFLVNEASDQPYFPTNAGIRWVSNYGRISNQRKRKQRRRHYFTGLAKWLSLWFGLLEIGKEYDVIMANQSLTAWPVAFAPCGSAKKFYYVQAYEPECLEFGYENMDIKRKVEVWLSRKSYDLKLIQVSNSPVYIHYENVRAQSWVPPGVDFEIFFPKREYKTFSSAEEIVIGCIGRKEPFKGMQYVLEAFETLWAQDHRYKLHVAFDNIPGGWSHPGLIVSVPKSDIELGEYYRSVDIMIAHGMLQLGGPYLPVMEAMACGTPVVNTGHVPANAQNSWLIRSGDVESIVVAIRTLAADVDYRERVAIASTDIAPYEWSKVSKRMLELFSATAGRLR